MNDDSNIPLLEDVIYRGKGYNHKEAASLSSDENAVVEIEPDDFEVEPVTEKEVVFEEDYSELLDIETQPEKHNHETETTAEISDQQLDPEPNNRELLIDEEIRQILDKHMKEAYNEIIRLISHKIR